MGLSENMAPLSVCRNWLFRTAALAAQALERTCRVNALLLETTGILSANLGDIGWFSGHLALQTGSDIQIIRFDQ
jgi:hypothetical protein